MALPNYFEKTTHENILSRINQLNNDTPPQWGTMSVDKMLAHCCVTYEMAFEDKHPKPGAFKRFLLKLLVKKAVVGEKEYSKNGATAPEFIIKNERDFEKEKSRLITYINKSYQLGADYFDGKESHSFGALNKTEWNNMFYKHLDHHLRQFGV